MSCMIMHGHVMPATLISCSAYPFSPLNLSTASCLHHFPSHIRHRSPRLHQRCVCPRLGELHDPPYAHGVVVLAPATMAAASSGLHHGSPPHHVARPPPPAPATRAPAPATMAAASSGLRHGSPLHRVAGGGRLPSRLPRGWRDKRRRG